MSRRRCWSVVQHGHFDRDNRSIIIIEYFLVDLHSSQVVFSERMTRTMMDLEEELGRIYGLVGELSGMSIVPSLTQVFHWSDPQRRLRRLNGSYT